MFTHTIIPSASKTFRELVIGSQPNKERAGIKVDHSLKELSLQEFAVLLDAIIPPPSEFTEIFNPFQDDKETYLAKVCLPEGRWIAVLSRQVGKCLMNNGTSGYIVLTMCMYDRARRNFKSGRWLTMDGKQFDLMDVTEEIMQANIPPPPVRNKRNSDGTIVVTVPTKICKGPCQAQLPLSAFAPTKGVLRNTCRLCYNKALRNKRASMKALFAPNKVSNATDFLEYLLRDGEAKDPAFREKVAQALAERILARV